MNGAQAVFFYGVAYGQLLTGGGVTGGSGAGGEEPNRPWRPNKPGHEADAVPPVRRRTNKRTKNTNKPAAAAGERFPCPICDRLFDQVKAVHGHQRSHPEREWRGMAPPRPPPPVTADGKQYRYACERCGAPFETRQALGGHRASHSGKMGCFWLSRHQNQQPAADVLPPPPAAPAAIVFAFDLNEPAPQDDEE